MANKDIPIDSGSDFTADVVKAVEAIAQNVKNSATAFTANFDKVSNSIKTMQKAVVTSVKQIKLVAPVNKKDVKKDEPKDLTSEFSRVVEAIQNIKLVPIVEKQNKKEPKKETKESKKEKVKEPKEVKQPKQKDYSKDISSGFKSVTTSVKDMTKQIVASVGKIKSNSNKPEKTKTEKKNESEGKENFAEDISSGFEAIVSSIYEASILITNAVLEVGTEIVNAISKSNSEGNKEKPKEENKEETKGKSKEENKEVTKEKTKVEPKEKPKQKSGPNFTPVSSMSKKEKSIIKKEGYKDKSGKEQPKAQGITIAKAVIEIQQAIIVLGKGKEDDKKKDKKEDKKEDKKKTTSTGKDNSLKSIFEDVKSTISSFMKGNKAEGMKKAKGIVGNFISNKTNNLMGGAKGFPKSGMKPTAGGIGGKIGGPALALLGAGISKLMQGAGIAATAIKKHGIELAKKIPGADRIIKGSLVNGQGNKAAKKVGGKIGGSIGAEAAGAAAAGLGMALNSVTGAVGIASGAIGMFGSYIEKSNPALMEQFGIILNDLGGVIGRSLAPVIQTLLPLFRQFADYIDYAMKLIQPSIDIVITAFKELAGPLMEAGATILQVFAPVLTFAAKIIEGLVIVVTPIIDAFILLLEAVGEIFGIFLSGSSITKIMMDGFKLLADMVKILVGAIVWAAGAFYQVIGAAIKGIGTLIDWIPGTGKLGETLIKMGEDADKAGAKLRQSGANMISSGLTGKPEAKKPSKIKPNASVGASVRDAQEMSITGIGDDIRKAAMMAATGTKTQEESLAEIAKGLSKQNLADAVKAGVVAANADNKGSAAIVGGNNPLRKIEKPFLAPV